MWIILVLKIICCLCEIHTSLVAQLVKHLPAMQEMQFDPWITKIPWRSERLPTPVFLGFPCDSDDKKSACNERDLDLISEFGRSPLEGNGNPLQYSCLENIPWTEEPGGLQSMESQKVRHN